MWTRPPSISPSQTSSPDWRGSSGAARFVALAHRVQHRHDARARARAHPASPSIAAELLHFLGEVEVVFGLWAVVLLGVMTVYSSREAAKHYFNDTVNYTEPMFVVVIMSTLAETPLFFGATALTAVNDNALIIYLATLVPNLGDELTCGGPGRGRGRRADRHRECAKPGGAALLGRFFDGAISPLGLLAGALGPTLIAALVFRAL